MIVLATSNLNRVASSPTTMRFRFCLSHPLGVRQDQLGTSQICWTDGLARWLSTSPGNEPKVGRQRSIMAWYSAAVISSRLAIASVARGVTAAPRSRSAKRHRLVSLHGQYHLCI
jgi:hypothetical protein